MIERVGTEKFVEMLLSDDILARKEEILGDETLPKPRP